MSEESFVYNLICQVCFLPQEIAKRTALLFLVIMLVSSVGCKSGANQTITGTAATGDPLANATIIIQDSTGTTAEGTTYNDGTFIITVTNMKPPFMLQAIPTSGSKLYSILPEMDMTSENTQNVNITPITTLVIYELNPGINPATTFADIAYITMTTADVTKKEDSVRAKLPPNTMNSAFSMMYDKFIALAGGNDPYDTLLEVLGKGIVKRGTIAPDFVESTPFVFNGRLYRLEWMRAGGYLRIISHATGEELSRFGYDHALPSALVENGTVFVVGTRFFSETNNNWLTMFTSKDLVNWTEQIIFDNPDKYTIFNTSLTKTNDGYTMSMEINKGSKKDPPANFAARFLKSNDLQTWSLLPLENNHGYDRYTAPHCLRWANGWYYLFYLELISQDKFGKPTLFEQYVTRSKDLINWEYSPLNPVLSPSQEDKYIYKKSLAQQEQTGITTATNINNSDIDFTFYNGRLIINYSWGDQVGTEFLAEAEYYGTETDFLEGWFPIIP